MLGALIIDKPAGITSHDVVARIRCVAGTRRVGHAGTLDPFATGVLVVCVGKATRLAQFLVGLGKQYLATVRLGFATDTQDLTGKQITPSRSSKGLSLEEVSRVVTEFVGPQLQMPPMYSAKKVGGEKLYKAAREGREVAREPVAITIHSIELIETGGMLAQANADGATDLNVMVSCSSGTYVRTLANDIGERSGWARTSRRLGEPRSEGSSRRVSDARDSGSYESRRSDRANADRPVGTALALARARTGW